MFVIVSLYHMLQAIRIRYQHPDSELQDFALQVIDMLRSDNSADAHALVFSLIKPKPKPTLLSTLFLFF